MSGSGVCFSLILLPISRCLLRLNIQTTINDDTSGEKSRAHNKKTVCIPIYCANANTHSQHTRTARRTANVCEYTFIVYICIEIDIELVLALASMPLLQTFQCVYKHSVWHGMYCFQSDMRSAILRSNTARLPSELVRCVRARCCTITHLHRSFDFIYSYGGTRNKNAHTIHQICEMCREK